MKPFTSLSVAETFHRCRRQLTHSLPVFAHECRRNPQQLLRLIVLHRTGEPRRLLQLLPSIRQDYTRTPFLFLPRLGLLQRPHDDGPFEEHHPEMEVRLPELRVYPDRFPPAPLCLVLPP